MQQGMYNAFFNVILFDSFDRIFKHSAAMIREITLQLKIRVIANLANLNSQIIWILLWETTR